MKKQMRMSIPTQFISHCINCGEELNMAAAVGEDAKNTYKPTPGDFSVCAECGHLMIYDDELMPREPTPKEQIEIAGNKAVLEIQKQRILYKILGELFKSRND